MEAVGLDRRREANASWFAAEADRLAQLCRAMAERFARGGRLLAPATSRTPGTWRSSSCTR